MLERPMKRLDALVLMMLAIVALPAAQAPAEKIDLGMIAKIRDEGMTRSQVMDHIGWLSDVYGPRLTGGPGIMQASEWTLKTLAEWGLANPHRETFAFGKGWSLVRFSAHMIEPQIQPLIGFPGAWTPSTKGAVTAEVVRVDIETEADIEKYRGKLAGKIVLTQPARTVRLLEGPIVLRMTDKDFEEAKTIPPPRSRGGAGRGERGGEADEAGAAGDAGRGGRGGGNSLQQKIQQFYKSEGVVALLNRGGNSDMSAGGSDLSWQQQRPDGGTLFPSGGGSRGADAGTGCRR
jgi:carboxypeptidase Q